LVTLKNNGRGLCAQVYTADHLESGDVQCFVSSSGGLPLLIYQAVV